MSLTPTSFQTIWIQTLSNQLHFWNGACAEFLVPLRFSTCLLSWSWLYLCFFAYSALVKDIEKKCEFCIDGKDENGKKKYSVEKCTTDCKANYKKCEGCMKELLS